MSVLTGITSPWEQPGEYGRTDAGTYRTQIFEATDKVSIDQLVNAIEAASAIFGDKVPNYRTIETHGKKRLEIQLPTNTFITETPVNIWDYSSQKVQKDLLSASVPTGITSTLTQTNVELIRRCVANDFTQTADKTTLVATDFKDGNPTNALTIYKLVKAGVSDAFVQAPSIKHTQVVSFQYPITLAKLNVGKILSTPTLIALENPPTWAVTGLPTDLPPNLEMINLSFGWYKNAPGINEIANRKFQVVQEYEYGLWPTDTFGQPL